MIQKNLQGEKANLSKNIEEEEPVGEQLTGRSGFTNCYDCNIPGNGHRDMFVVYDQQEDKVYCRRCLTDWNYEVEHREVFSEE